MPISIVGLGATGSHTARQLRDADELILHDTSKSRAKLVSSALVGANARIDRNALQQGEVVVLATPAGTHPAFAAKALDAGAHVVSISDRPSDVSELLALDPLARQRGRSLVVGAGFAPGLTCLLARHASGLLDTVDSIAVWKTGTGGPACARQHHRALKRPGSDWIDGTWLMRRGGSGRDLAWFPDPIGAADCYRASLPSPLLLQRAFPDARRISARLAATRRDRFTSWLPMLRPPHADGGPGAIRVELRGQRDGAIETVVYAVMDHPSVAAGTVAAVAARHAADGGFEPGAFGLAEVDEPLTLLQPLHTRGIRAATYEGSGPISPR